MATKSLYVGNLPYDISETDLRDVFEPYGPIREVRLIGNKGFAFVEIPEENVAAAIEGTNGQDLGGRAMTVNEARPRPDSGRGGGGMRPPRSGGGGGGFHDRDRDSFRGGGGGGGGGSRGGGSRGGGGGGGRDRRW